MPRLEAGETALDPVQAHHARNVLRLTEGARVEVFDDAGHVAAGSLRLSDGGVAVWVERVEEPAGRGAAVNLTIASAVPKGDRAEWMVEKLSELGVAAFVPLAAARSVVLPEGKNKRERWVRIATEAAKQCRRAGVMRVGELTTVGAALSAATTPWFLATEAGVETASVGDAARTLSPGSDVCAFVGPEGGWTDDELRQFAEAGARGVRLTDTVLRVETAAVAVAAVVGCLGARGGARGGRPPEA